MTYVNICVWPFFFSFLATFIEPMKYGCKFSSLFCTFKCEFELTAKLLGLLTIFGIICLSGIISCRWFALKANIVFVRNGTCCSNSEANKICKIESDEQRKFWLILFINRNAHFLYIRVWFMVYGLWFWGLGFRNKGLGQYIWC